VLLTKPCLDRFVAYGKLNYGWVAVRLQCRNDSSDVVRGFWKQQQQQQRQSKKAALP